MLDAPLTPASMLNKLRTHGIVARAERSTALAQLAAEMPPAVLSEVLGVHISTAVRWNSVAAQDWSRYLLARRETPGGHGVPGT
jgi:hypothetical protein